MKDKLEDFIRSNREEFDDKVPRSDLWGQIEATLKEEEKRPSYSWVWKVAAVVFLASTLVLLFENNIRETPKEEIAENQGYNSELVDVENYYTRLISEKKKEILASDIQSSELLLEIDVLDSMYMDLKNDLMLNHEDDRLMNAMIRNLQLRVKILNKQLNILEHIQNMKSYEDVSI